MKNGIDPNESLPDRIAQRRKTAETLNRDIAINAIDTADPDAVSATRRIPGGHISGTGTLRDVR